MSFIHSFPPLAEAGAKVLILGSMPGKASLLAQQYYAHPRNAFWPIVESLFGISIDLPYQQRCTQLMAQHIAVWDVLKTCTRTSSLDSDIDEATIVANDFGEFFNVHTDIRAVYFNGATAEKIYRKRVLPELSEASAALPATRLPSTSPANATLNFQAKLAQWQIIKQ